VRYGTVITMRLRAVLAGFALVSVLASACSGAPTAPSPQATGATTSPTTLPTVVETINPSIAPMVQPTSPPSTIFTDWTLHPMPIAVPGIYGGNNASDVVRFGRGFVAVGSVNGGCCDASFSEQTRALVWRSRDGAMWRLVANDKAFQYGRMNAVAANGTRLVAVGYRSLRDGIEPLGAAWTSIDGSIWHLARDVPIFDDVVATGSDFVAVANSEVGPSIWSSADGNAWRRTVGNDLGSGVAIRLIQLEDGYLMIGTDDVSGDDGYTSIGVIWRSANGITWERVPAQASLEQASIDDAARIGDLYVAVGPSDVEEGGFALISTDGITWARTTEPPFAGVGLMVNRLMSAHGALVLTGWDPGATTSPFRAWTSSDGRSWAEVRAQRGTAGPGIEIEGWVLGEDGIVAVGRASRAGETVAPAAWVIR
jgi:hypothetical protein